MSKQLPLTNGKFALVDDSDFEILSRFRWQVLNADDISKTWVGRAVMGRFIPLWKFIIPTKAGNYKVTFLDKNPFNFQKINLSMLSLSNHNGRSKKYVRVSPSTSKYKGVCFRNPKDKKSFWQANIQKKEEGRTVIVRKNFPSEIEAALFYNEKAREFFGETAFQNVIE